MLKLIKGYLGSNIKESKGLEYNPVADAPKQRRFSENIYYTIYYDQCRGQQFNWKAT